MEPETSAPQHAPEQAPKDYGPERVSQPTPERGLLEVGSERIEQIAETTARVSDIAGASVVDPTAVVSDDVASDTTSGVITPATANDDDLIEKEWVDRAKRIVTDTGKDPYKQEEAVVRLQKDYQKKRFGRELGEAA